MNSNIDVRAMLPVGTVLQGRYRIEQYLASGGFGNTYKAFDTNWNEVVAVKEFFMRGVSLREDDSISVSVSNPISSGVFEAQKDKFRKEAARLRKLRNDHIVEVKDRFDENGTVYYVMDYIEGQSLRDVVSQQGPLTEQQVRQYLDQVLEALEVVHREGMLHLDIKPANIMVSKNVDGSMRVRLIDFGASKQQKAEGGATSTSALSYTTGYAPLEQKDQQFDNFGPWTDFYALGATLYNVLTAQLPPTPTDITDYGIDAFRFPATMSQQMRQLIVWMMTNRRYDRPQSVEQVREFLRESVAPQPPSPPQPSQDEETVLDSKPLPPVPNDTASHASRRWLFVGLGGVVVATILVLLFALPKGESVQPAVSPQVAELAEQIISSPTSEFVEPALSPVLQSLVDNMVYVEGGTFQMGGNDSDAESDEKPVHQVTLSSYYIGKYEVTQEEWEAVMGSNPSNFRGARLPVEQVSWDDCQTFIQRLNQQTGQRFRLPTEAEWEFAARGGNAGKSHSYKYSGNTSINAVGWYTSNSGSQTHPVGQKQANELGLFDMTGNVWEWCQDWYGSYSSQSQTNPTGPSSASDRVSRGGSWGYYAWFCRVSSRGIDAPSCRYSRLGLRLAR